MTPKTRRSNSNKNPTVADVARAAGVSTATVSRVLAGFDAVSEQSRARVRAAIQKLGYQYNRNARNLRKRTTSKIGVLVSDIQNPFFGSVVRGIERVAIEGDFTIFLGNSDEDPEREKKLILMFLEEAVAGIILAPTDGKAGFYKELIKSGTPLVVVDRRIERAQLDSVLVNGSAGAETAVEYLVGLGHDRIGFVGGLERLSVMRDREEGYLAALRRHKLPVAPEYLRRGNNRQEGGYLAVRDLLALERPPSALLIANNMMTLGGLQAIHESGLRIPEQISLVGFDDMDWTPSLRPPLTVVAQPAYEMGERAAALLLERIRAPGRPRQSVLLDTQLIIRASCARPAGL